MIIVSGIQPSGRLHIGNYLGAVRNWLELQKDANNRCFFFIADWHSLTEDYDPKEKAAQIRELAAEILACGIDQERVTFFRQSDLPEHLELAWYFSCVTPIAELQRMTQYKDKIAHGESSNTGLFTYPVLQAADVLMYSLKSQVSPRPSVASGEGGSLKSDTIGVPVGRDQVQHIELMRDIARWFNNRFGETFPETKPLLTESTRIMSLKDPMHKMSKSLGGDHCLFLDDTPEEITRKLRAATTDMGPTQNAEGGTQNQTMSPGVETLFSIFAAMAPVADVESFRHAHTEGTLKYSDFKPAIAAAFTEYFAGFRKRKAELLADPATIDAILARGAEAARAVATATLRTVRTRIGIR